MGSIISFFDPGLITNLNVTLPSFFQYDVLIFCLQEEEVKAQSEVIAENSRGNGKGERVVCFRTADLAGHPTG